MQSLMISHRDRAHHAVTRLATKRAGLVSSVYNANLHKEKIINLDRLKADLTAALEAYTRAYTAFSVLATDTTMIHVVGTWARLHRLILTVEENYK